ncbi:MAG: hypothetical protein AAFR76_14025, partial [Planctomycetota bacterium]
MQLSGFPCPIGMQPESDDDDQGKRERRARSEDAAGDDPVPAGELLKLIDDAGWPSNDRLIAEKSTDIVCKLIGGLIASRTLFGERFGDDGLDIAA